MGIGFGRDTLKENAYAFVLNHCYSLVRPGHTTNDPKRKQKVKGKHPLPPNLKKGK